MKNELVTIPGSGMAFYEEDRFGKVMAFANQISKAAIVPDALRGKPADIAIILLNGVELGLQPMQALQGIHVVNGSPTLNGKSMLSLIRSRAPFIKISFPVNTMQEVHCKMIRGDEEFTSEWTWDRAEMAGLTGKKNWQKHRMEMMRWRCVAECARIICPDVIQNVYLPEEVEQDPDSPPPPPFKSEIDITAEVEKTKEKLADPENVESSTKKDVIVEAQVISQASKNVVANDLEANEMADIIQMIPNRDFTITIGGFKGKQLWQIEIKDLRAYLETINKSMESKGKTKPVKLSDVHTAMIANISAYLSKFDSILAGPEETKVDEKIVPEVVLEMALEEKIAQARDARTKHKTVKDSTFSLEPPNPPDPDVELPSHDLFPPEEMPQGQSEATP